MPVNGLLLAPLNTFVIVCSKCSCRSPWMSHWGGWCAYAAIKVCVHARSWYWKQVKTKVHFLSPDIGHMRTVSANERRCYLCNIFSHWLKLFSCDLIKNILCGRNLDLQPLLVSQLASSQGTGYTMLRGSQVAHQFSVRTRCITQYNWEGARTLVVY